MKIFKLLTLTVLMTGLISSCNEQNETISEIESPQFVAVAIPDAFKATETDISNAEEIKDLIADVVFVTEEGKELPGQVHMVMVGDSKLSAFEVSPNILNENGWDANFWLEQYDPNAPVTEGDCEDDCRAEYVDEEGNPTKKLDGCLVGCFLGKVLEIAVIGIIIEAISS